MITGLRRWWHNPARDARRLLGDAQMVIDNAAAATDAAGIGRLAQRLQERLDEAAEICAAGPRASRCSAR